MDLFDVEAIEAAEAKLDQFIEKRAREARDANKVAQLWEDSERRHRERRRERLREEWREYHLRTAEGLERTAAELAADHRARAEALCAGEGKLPETVRYRIYLHRETGNPHA